MPNPQNRRRHEQPSTYVVQDRELKDELIRLTIQDRWVTTAMGGPLPEQPAPTVFRRVLDIGCGPGGWAVEAAKAYATMSLVGIDISQRMIEYARSNFQSASLIWSICVLASVFCAPGIGPSCSVRCCGSRAQGVSSGS
jgi:ubiquinone/menaquinone biosynthesis C-methylase UbiE